MIMKNLFTTLLFLLVVCIAAAQTKSLVKDPPPLSPTSNVLNYVGKDCAIADTMYGYKTISNNMTLLDIGGIYPNEVLTIVLKGKDFNLKLAALIGKVLYVKGTVVLYHDKPEIVVTDPANIYLFTDYEQQ